MVIVAEGWIDAIKEVEEVGVGGARVGPRGPVVASTTSVGKLLIVSIDIPAPHKE